MNASTNLSNVDHPARFNRLMMFIVMSAQSIFLHRFLSPL